MSEKTKSAEEIQKRIEERLQNRFGITVEDANSNQIYQAVSRCLRDDIMDVWVAGRTKSQKEGDKCVIYLSA